MIKTQGFFRASFLKYPLSSSHVATGPLNRCGIGGTIPYRIQNAEKSLAGKFNIKKVSYSFPFKCPGKKVLDKKSDEK